MRLSVLAIAGLLMVATILPACGGEGTREDVVYFRRAVPLIKSYGNAFCEYQQYVSTVGPVWFIADDQLTSIFSRTKELYGSAFSEIEAVATRWKSLKPPSELEELHLQILDGVLEDQEAVGRWLAKYGEGSATQDALLEAFTPMRRGQFRARNFLFELQGRALELLRNPEVLSSSPDLLDLIRVNVNFC